MCVCVRERANVCVCVRERESKLNVCVFLPSSDDARVEYLRGGGSSLAHGADNNLQLPSLIEIITQTHAHLRSH